jgi:hypothetical protein
MLSGYIEKELSERDEEMVREHLAVCPSCSLIFQQVEELKTHLGKLGTFELSADFNERLKKRIDADAEENSFFSSKNVSWSLGALLVLIAVYFLFMLFPPADRGVKQSHRTAPPSQEINNTAGSFHNQNSENNASDVIKPLEDAAVKTVLPLEGDTATGGVKNSGQTSINLIEDKK